MVLFLFQFSTANVIFTKIFDKNVKFPNQKLLSSLTLRIFCLADHCYVFCLQPYLSLPASSPFMANERGPEPETQEEVAKALRGREKEGLVTIPNIIFISVST